MNCSNGIVEMQRKRKEEHYSFIILAVYVDYYTPDKRVEKSRTGWKILRRERQSSKVLLRDADIWSIGPLTATTTAAFSVAFLTIFTTLCQPTTISWHEQSLYRRRRCQFAVYILICNPARSEVVTFTKYTERRSFSVDKI